MPLSRIWVAMLTRQSGADPNTGSSISLSINAGGTDLLNHVFPQTTQEDQDRGQANLYEVNVKGKRIEPGQLTDSSVRLHILDDDAWSPEHFFAWGEVPPRTALQNPTVVPLVIETGIPQTLSTDPTEGVSDIALRRVAKGGSNMRIRRLLILLTTAEGSFGFFNPGSLEIQIISNDRLVTLCDISFTAQTFLSSGEANFFTMPVIFPFTKGDLDNDSITLRVKGISGEWLPASFFLFGLNDAAGRPASIVPLVHLPKWPFGPMVLDTTNGIASRTLPLVQEGDVTESFDDGGVLTLRSIEAGQRVTNQLLEQLVAGLK